MCQKRAAASKLSCLTITIKMSRTQQKYNISLLDFLAISPVSFEDIHMLEQSQNNLIRIETNAHSNWSFDPVHGNAFEQSPPPFTAQDIHQRKDNILIGDLGNESFSLHSPPDNIKGIRCVLANETSQRSEAESR